MNTGKEEYFHPKTTPDIPVRVAVRMSISVPGKQLGSEVNVTQGNNS